MRVFLVGVLIGLVLQFFHADGVKILFGIGWVEKVWNLVGVSLVGLVPLSIFLMLLVTKHSFKSGPIKEKERMHYDLISSHSLQWGLLGTVFGLVSGIGELGGRILSGASAETITEIIPAVAEALISTALGICIWLVADGSERVIVHVKGVNDEEES